MSAANGREMHIKSIRLLNFRRVTDLKISGIPATAKLVMLTGPNGNGKSSLFDAFMTWHLQLGGSWLSVGKRF